MNCTRLGKERLMIQRLEVYRLISTLKLRRTKRGLEKATMFLNLDDGMHLPN